jgi:hypothetical protein
MINTTDTTKELDKELQDLLDRPINNWLAKEEYIVKHYAKEPVVKALVCQNPNNHQPTRDNKGK